MIVFFEDVGSESHDFKVTKGIQDIGEPKFSEELYDVARTVVNALNAEHPMTLKDSVISITVGNLTAVIRRYQQRDEQTH